MAAARAYIAARLPLPCTICGKTVKPGDAFTVAHIVERWKRPDLTWTPSNWSADHKKCSDASGQRAVIEKARAEGREGRFSPGETAGESPPLPFYTHANVGEPVSAREGLSWAELCTEPPEWLQPYLEVPEDAAPPLYVSGVHPEATGSYGPEAIEWMETTLTERGRGLQLRWWQRLAMVLQLQHRADGSLCWRVVVESTPRRAGKSVRLRSLALWRLENGPEMFEPEQLVVHTGKDLAIVREVMRKAWAWAAVQDDWGMKRGMTEPEVSYQEVNRWVARSKDATTGYDCCLALVDEAWDVPPASIDDDLEPSMLERVSPQLVLTSTAHRRATSLMRGRIMDALSVDDGETLLLMWAAPVDADPGDPDAWRAASPFWTEDRRRMIASKYEKAKAGEADPEADVLDPLAGFTSQYCNIWRLRTKTRAVRGEPVVTEDDWISLETPAPFELPDAAAIESWFADGVSLALAWRDGDGVIVTASDHPDLASAVEALRESGFTGHTTVGTSLHKDPALKGVRVRKGEGRVANAAQALQRLVAAGTLHHDGAEFLTEQVTTLRTTPGADGPRMASNGRADAVKAAVWAVEAVRTSKGRPRVLTPRAS